MLVVDPVKDEAVEEDGNSERYKVLVVEDNASLLAWLKEILSSRYDVYTASDGADALDIVNGADRHHHAEGGRLRAVPPY